jgi:myo-inositol-1(or 4)-monophosphatase
VRASVRGGLATALVATGFGYAAHVRGSQARVVARLLPRVRDVRRFVAAALDLARAAAGRFDA